VRYPACCRYDLAQAIRYSTSLKLWPCC
jgi:hypothetical protein